MNTLVSRALGHTSAWPRVHEPLVCLRNAHRYGVHIGAVYYASRDLEGNDKTIGISTEAGDIEVPADFLPPGHEDDPLNLPPGGWKTAFAFGYALTVHKAQGSEFNSVLLIDECHILDLRRQWLYTGITRAAGHIVVARDS
jgi:exodeoxyribonuclease-5